MIIACGQPITSNENSDITYMTIVTDNVPRSNPKQLSLFQELLISLGVLILLTGGIAFLISATVLPAMLLVFSLMFVAIPYTLVVTLIAIINRRNAKKKVAHDIEDNAVTHNEYETVANFKARWQRWTLSFNIILALTYIPLMLSIVHTDFSSFMIVGGSVAEVGAIFMIILNRHFIYKKMAIEAEEYALASHTAASKFIKVNRIWSWITWYMYCLVPLSFLLNFDALFGYNASIVS